MEATDWKIARPAGACVTCQAKFQIGQTYYSALHEEGRGFVRRDYCTRCFRELQPETLFSFWKTAVPEEDPAQRKPVLDPASVLEFFKRLAAERDPQRVAFRYVLALMLTRKKLLRLSGPGRKGEDATVLLFTERLGGARHEVVQPDLAESEVLAVSEELGRLLGLAPPAPPAPPAPGEQPVSAH